MPGRSYSSGSYRYGFNGKENDNEVKGVGNQYDYGFRVYDPRMAKFLSVDPLQNKYPELTPYQFSSNSPIANFDLDGREDYNVNIYLDSKGHYMNSETPTFRAGVVQKWIGEYLGWETNKYYYAIVYQNNKLIGAWNVGSTDNLEKFKTNEGYRNSLMGTPDVSDQEAVNREAWLDEYNTNLRSGLGLQYGLSRKQTPSDANITAAKINEQATASNGGNRNAAKTNTAITLKNSLAQQGAGFKSYNTKVSDGKISMITAKGSVNTTGRYDFVVTNDGKLVIGTGHYNLSGGASSVQAAGQIKIVNGQVREITNSSGHYQPTVKQGQQSVNILQNAGISTTGARVSLYNADGSLNKTYINK